MNETLETGLQTSDADVVQSAFVGSLILSALTAALQMENVIAGEPIELPLVLTSIVATLLTGTAHLGRQIDRSD
jgi:hypothetical protein